MLECVNYIITNPFIHFFLGIVAYKVMGFIQDTYSVAHGCSLLRLPSELRAGSASITAG